MTHVRTAPNRWLFPKRYYLARWFLPATSWVFRGFPLKVPLSDCLDDGRPQKRCGAELTASSSLSRQNEARAIALHNLNRLRARHFVSPIMADQAMSVVLTLFISECQDMTAGEQAILLANHIAPLEGAVLLDTLVQAGLVVATGKMPGRRTVGLTPLGSARMRAYIIDSSDLM